MYIINIKKTLKKNSCDYFNLQQGNLTLCYIWLAGFSTILVVLSSILVTVRGRPLHPPTQTESLFIFNHAPVKTMSSYY